MARIPVVNYGSSRMLVFDFVLISLLKAYYLQSIKCDDNAQSN